MKKLKSGIKGFEKLVEGGIPSGNAVLIQSPSSTENRAFSYQFIKEGLLNSEPVLVVVSEISPDNFRLNIEAYGLNVKEYEDRGLLVIVDWYSYRSRNISGVEEYEGLILSSKDLTHLGVAISRSIKALHEAPNRRAVLDILSTAFNYFDYNRAYNFIQAMKSKLKENGLTSLFLISTEAREKRGLAAIHNILDGVIDIKSKRVEDKIERQIGIISMAGASFESKYLRLNFIGNELEIEGGRKRSEDIKLASNDQNKSIKTVKRSELDERLSDLKILIRADPGNPKLWFSLAYNLVKRKQYEYAVRACDRVIELMPDHGEVWTLKANSLRILGREDEAAECYKKSVEVGIKSILPGQELPFLKEFDDKLIRMLREEEEPDESLEMDLGEYMEEIIEEYVCPSCNQTITAETTKCPGCGVEFMDMEEVPDGLAARYVDIIEEYVCPACGESITAETTVCPGCGVQFLEMEEVPDEILSKAEKAPEVIAKSGEVEKQVIPETMRVPESSLEELDDQLDKLGEDVSRKSEVIDVEEVEAVEIFTCPFCKVDVNIGATKCPECGVSFDGTAVAEREQEEESPNFYICHVCSSVALVDLGECSVCGAKIWFDEASIEDSSVKKSRATIMLPKDGQVYSFEKVNVKRRFAYGLTEGITNGLTNGLTSGFTIGMKKVRGSTDGLTNGLVNGLRQLRVGLTNGLTNGNGITNGLGISSRFGDEKKCKLRFFITPLIIFFLITLPFIIASLQTPDGGIAIDGRFRDWDGVIGGQCIENPGYNDNIDIVEYKVHKDTIKFSFYLRVKGQMLAGEPSPGKKIDTVHIFIDIDQNPKTGYYINGIGSEYMIRIYGRAGRIISSQFLRYPRQVKGAQAWNYWEVIGTVPAAVNGSELETQFSNNALGLVGHTPIDVYFYTQSWDRYDDYSDTIVNQDCGVLDVVQRGVGVDSISGNDNMLLRLEMRALNSNMRVNEIKVTRTGIGADNDARFVKLINSIGSELDNVLLVENNATFSTSIEIQEGEGKVFYVVADIAGSAQDGNTIGFEVANNHDILVDFGTVSLRRAQPEESENEVSYINTIPLEINIDGAFADWFGRNATVYNDLAGEIKDENIDIIRYGVGNTSDGVAFYLNVEGEILGGIKVPYWNDPKIRNVTIQNDFDFDGIPNHLDTFPYDFDNDGIRDEMDDDDDNDGILDYPEGEDILLEQSETGARRFLGPSVKIPEPLKTGEDYACIYIDSKPNEGYISGDFPIRPDSMIMIIGRHGKITHSYYYNWSESIRSWEKMGEVPSLLDSMQMEVEINYGDIGLNASGDSYEVYFMTSHWDNLTKDYSDVREPLSGRGTRGTATQLTCYLGSTPTIDGDFSTSEWDDADSYTISNTLKIYTKHDATYAYFCAVALHDTEINVGDNGTFYLDRAHDASASPDTNDSKYSANCTGPLGYIQKFESLGFSLDNWYTQNLSSYGVQPGDICEIVFYGRHGSLPTTCGARTNGSFLDRTITIHEAEGFGAGGNTVRMHVKADAKGHIQIYFGHESGSSSADDVYLVGYWDVGDYTETAPTLYNPTQDATWHALTMSAIPANKIGEVILANNRATFEYLAGVREVGSSLDRYFDLHEAEPSDNSVLTLFVEADASQQVEVYAEDDKYVDFYSIGYWNNPPGTWTEKSYGLTNPSSNDNWEDVDLSSEIVNGAVCEMAPHNRADASGNTVGIREKGSSINRYITLDEAEGGGNNYWSGHVKSDADAVIEYYTSDNNPVTGTYFKLTGYWDLSISSPWEYVWYNGSGTDWSLGTAPSGADFAVDVDNDPYSAVVYECKVPLSNLDSEGNFSDDGEIIGFAFKSIDASDSSTGFYSSSASDTDTTTWADLIYQSVVIPEFPMIEIPLIATFLFYFTRRRKKRKKETCKGHYEDQNMYQNMKKGGDEHEKRDRNGR